MMLAIMFVLFSMPGLMDTIISVGYVSSEVSNLENIILHTDISLDSLAATSNMPSFSFNLNNNDLEKLWNYDDFDVLVTYDADISGTKTRVTESIPFKALDFGYTILDEVVSTTAAATSTGAYLVITDMTSTVNVVGPNSHILFHTNITFESNSGSNASCRIALFIDGFMVTEAEDSSDDNSPDEPGNVGLTWWETGLASGAHTFDVRWLDQLNDCAIMTNTERSLQVIEFTPGGGIPTILTEVTSSSGESYTATYQPVSGMKGSPSIDGPDSLVFTTGTVSFEDDAGSDASCFLGIFIDGVLQAEQQTYTDNANEASSNGVMWAETGLSLGAHTFELQAKEGQTGCETDTAMQRHMQVVDFTSGNPTILAEETSTALQFMTGAYLPITTLFDTVTIDGPGSVVLFTATVTFDAQTADAEGDAALFIDGLMVAEGRTFIEAGNTQPGHVNLHWWDTGLSAGSHLFEVMGKEGDPDAETDTQTQSHMQVVEFSCIKQWNIVSITNDVLDPGLLNSEETAKISVKLCNPIFSNGNVIVSVSTDNGVTATISGIAT